MKKIIRLTESDLVRIVQRVIKEDRGTEVTQEIIDYAKGLIGKEFNATIYGKDNYDQDRRASGFFKITSNDVNTDGNRLNLELYLTRTDDMSSRAIKDYSAYALKGHCDHQDKFNFTNAVYQFRARRDGNIINVRDVNFSITGKRLEDTLSREFCPMYIAKGSDF